MQNTVKVFADANQYLAPGLESAVPASTAVD